jgi:BMFP domain-containing protein YqiC
MAEHGGGAGRVGKYHAGFLQYLEAPKGPSVPEGLAFSLRGAWPDVASREEYEPLTQQILQAAILGAGLADLLSRMESLEGALGSATDQMKALGKRVAALEERLAEQGVVRNAMLCDLGHEGYSLRCPIIVIIEEYEEETVARLPEVEAFASAATEPEALALLKEDIIRLYEDLASTPEEQLGTLPRQWRAVLLRLVEKNGAP